MIRIGATLDPTRRRVLTPLAIAWLLAAPAAPAASLDPSVSGLDGELRRNFLAHLGELPADLAERPDKLQRRLDEALRDGLQPFGYYEASVSHRLEGSRLRLDVDRGAPVLTGAPDLQVTGDAAELPTVRELLQNPPLAIGEPLRHQQYERLKAQLLAAARRDGFLDADYRRSRLLVDLETRRAQAELWLDGGPRYRFGEVGFAGGRVDPKVLERLNRVGNGPYSSDRITTLTRQLQDTNYFRGVRVEERRRDEDLRVDLDVRLEDGPKHRYDLGLGFSTDSSVRGRVAWFTPVVNERGHSQRSELFVSEPRSHLDFRYRIPGEHPLQDAFEITAGFQTREIQDNPLDSGTLGGHWTTLRGNGWQWTWGGSLQYEDYRVSAADEDSLVYLTPELTGTRLDLGTGLDPRRGLRLSAALEGSHETLGAEADFLRLHGGVRWLHPLGPGGTTLLLRGEVGVLLTDDVDGVPLSRRFFTGGDQTVRGYGFESIGPLDAAGEPSGGKYLNVASVELSRLVRDNWRVAAFADTGRAFTVDADSWSRSVGLGVRYLTPFGQIRLDLAVPLSDDAPDDFRFHLNIGPPL